MSVTSGLETTSASSPSSPSHSSDREAVDDEILASAIEAFKQPQIVEDYIPSSIRVSKLEEFETDLEASLAPIISSAKKAGLQLGKAAPTGISMIELSKRHDAINLEGICLILTSFLVVTVLWFVFVTMPKKESIHKQIDQLEQLYQSSHNVLESAEKQIGKLLDSDERTAMLQLVAEKRMALDVTEGWQRDIRDLKNDPDLLYEHLRRQEFDQEVREIIQKDLGITVNDWKEIAKGDLKKAILHLRDKGIIKDSKTKGLAYDVCLPIESWNFAIAAEISPFIFSDSYEKAEKIISAFKKGKSLSSKTNTAVYQPLIQKLTKAGLLEGGASELITQHLLQSRLGISIVKAV